MILNAVFVVCATIGFAHGMYGPATDVVELTAANFQSKVIQSDDLWLVEFYAPWCGHCQSLAPEWKKAATALKGIVNVGAVDMDQHQSVGGPYGIKGFPTIKTFGMNKNSPQDFQGARNAKAIVDEALKMVKAAVNARMNGGGRSSGGGGSSGGSGGSGSADDVIELTDSNFEKEVMNSKEPWLVEFFAPWCGHCQRLAPEWTKAASELKGKVKMGTLDATVHTVMASRYGVQGYPTIKVFSAGAKDSSSVSNYEGGRTASDIVAYALELHTAAIEPPEVIELVNDDKLRAECNEKPICVISVLPDILDTQAAGRNEMIEMLKVLGDKYKRKMWGWVWTPATTHQNLESALGMGGFGYPALAVVNIRKKVYVPLKGSFSSSGIDELLKSIAVGRGRTEPLRDGLPKLEDRSPWDGKDGELPVEEEFDLKDLEDDNETPTKEEL